MASSILNFPEFCSFHPKSSLPRCSTSRPFFSSNPTHTSFSIHSDSFLKTRIQSSSRNCNSLSLHRRPRNFRVFQNTLRVGRQSPVVALTSKEKLDISLQHERLGVDTIETELISTSEADFEAVKIIAKEVGNGLDENGYVPVICVLSRRNEDTKRDWVAVKYAKGTRIHTFIATSEIYREYNLRKNTKEALDIESDMFRFARSLGYEFIHEEATRCDREFLHAILGEVIKPGATGLNRPHTVGITMPSVFRQMIADIKANTPGIENIIISTHCQNDLGLSTANAIAGVCTCARQVEVTIKIIGSRARNASMEEVVMDLKCRRGVYTGIDIQHIVMASKMVEKYTGLLVQPDKLRKSTEEALDIKRDMFRFAQSLGYEFIHEEASRCDREFLHAILGEVIKPGATGLNRPHTVGITMPSVFRQMIADIKANTPGIENIIISTHCQNDLGLSTANAIAGACTCARQVEVTIKIIGSRARNASMEEVVMDLKCRRGVCTRINTQHIVMASKMVEEYSGLHVQPDKAIVGANAFAHESGIHQDGIQKHKGTYEIISPKDIGLESSNEAGIVLGKHSGRLALRDRWKELGYEPDDVPLENIFRRLKEVAGQKKRVTDAVLVTLDSGEFQLEFVELLDLQGTCGTLGLYTATVKLIDADGREHIACLVGTGAVDSAYKAFDIIIKVQCLKSVLYMGLHVLPHKAIVRVSAFAHECGIHQDGMLKYIGTYEIICPEIMGIEWSSEAGNILGKLGGRHALRDRLKELDDVLAQLRNISSSFKEVAEQKKRITEASPIALDSNEIFQQLLEWEVLGLKVTCGNIGGSAVVKVIDGDEREYLACSVGTSPVDTAYYDLNLKVRLHKSLPFLLPLAWIVRIYSLKVIEWWKKMK